MQGGTCDRFCFCEALKNESLLGEGGFWLMEYSWSGDGSQVWGVGNWMGIK